MIYDTFTYNGEKDMLEIRLNILSEYVDKFIIIEFDKSFSGKDKPQYFDIKDFKQWEDKIEYHYVTEPQYLKYMDLALSSPNTIGAEHWKREFCQKESIKDFINFEDDDLCFVGDVDEIWMWSPLAKEMNVISKLKLKVYTYYLNNRSNEEFWGTVVGKYKDFKGKCLNHIRSTDHYKTDEYGGWHFTSMGGLEEVKRKLSDSYTRESYWTEQVENLLQTNFDLLNDFLGRGFVYTKDESDLPRYILNNKTKWKKLLL